MPELKCDFCGGPDRSPAWSFPCQWFDSGIVRPDGLNEASAGAWLACEGCHDLIVRGDRDQLVLRTVEVLVAQGISYRDMVAIAVRDLHDQFWQHREGPPVPLSDEMRAAALADLEPSVVFVDHRKPMRPWQAEWLRRGRAA